MIEGLFAIKQINPNNYDMQFFKSKVYFTDYYNYYLWPSVNLS